MNSSHLVIVDMKFFLGIVYVLIVFQHSLLVDGQEQTYYATSEEFGKTYLIRIGNHLNFTRANEFCVSNGGQLAQIKSRDET